MLKHYNFGRISERMNYFFQNDTKLGTNRMWSHLLFLFYLTAFMAGLMSTCMIIILILKTHRIELKAYLIYHLAISSLITTLGIRFYLVPFESAYGLVSMAIAHARYLSILAILFSAPYFLLVFLEIPRTSKHVKFLLAVFILELAQYVGFGFQNRIDAIGFILFEIGLSIYCFYLLYKCNYLSLSTLKKDFIKRGLKWQLCFVPGHIYDIFFYRIQLIFPALKEGWCFAVAWVSVWNILLIRESIATIIPSEAYKKSITKFSTLDHLPLTKREKELIPYIVLGKSNSEIGKILFISDSTVKRHIYNIFQKLPVKNRFEIINYFLDAT
jgi:DNA-binding CsgD family transcriptional regulator